MGAVRECCLPASARAVVPGPQTEALNCMTVFSEEVEDAG